MRAGETERRAMLRTRVRASSRLLDELIFCTLRGAASVLHALPRRWVITFADRCGDLAWLIDARGRRVGRQNLDVVFGESLSADEKRRLVRTSMRGSARAVAALLHAAPATPERLRTWVDFPPAEEARLHELARRYHGGVLVSGHLGSWELLLALPILFRGEADIRFLVEAITHPAVDRFLDWLRGGGGARGWDRHGAARGLHRHVVGGGIAALLVDRNVRREHGGIWAPFLGLQARTTPLPGWLARKARVVILPIVCLPVRGGRYRVAMGELLQADPDEPDDEADILRITSEINGALERVIRADPAAWNWTLKRFKSRPEKALGPYPAYSLWDPDQPEAP